MFLQQKLASGSKCHGFLLNFEAFRERVWVPARVAGLPAFRGGCREDPSRPPNIAKTVCQHAVFFECPERFGHFGKHSNLPSFTREKIGRSETQIPQRSKTAKTLGMFVKNCMIACSLLQLMLNCRFFRSSRCDSSPGPSLQN